MPAKGCALCNPSETFLMQGNCYLVSFEHPAVSIEAMAHALLNTAIR